MNLTVAAAASIIRKKEDGSENDRTEIHELIDGYCAGNLDNDNFARWLRAVMKNGMTLRETAALTLAMADSGVRLDWSDIDEPVVDKHSTGGVGDAISLVAVPLASACGVKVAKLSGRALGHTGGTLDKLECIPGLETALSTTEFKRQVAIVGCAIGQASDELAPADKKIYALRDKTNTISSVPLITSSVLSKKIAGGARYLVIDVKAGRSAFMQTVAEAQALAESLLNVGTLLGRYMSVFVTDMDSPLSNSIGDALELDDALTILENDTPSRFRDTALAIATSMVDIASRRGLVDDNADALEDAEEDVVNGKILPALHRGKAHDRFVAMVRAQGGDIDAFDRQFEASATISAERSGIVQAIDGRSLGILVSESKGAAAPALRKRIGLRSRKRPGDSVQSGEAIIQVFGIPESAELVRWCREAVSIGKDAPASIPPVLQTLYGEPPAEAAHSA